MTSPLPLLVPLAPLTWIVTMVGRTCSATVTVGQSEALARPDVDEELCRSAMSVPTMMPTPAITATAAARTPVCTQRVSCLCGVDMVRPRRVHCNRRLDRKLLRATSASSSGGDDRFADIHSSPY